MIVCKDKTLSHSKHRVVLFFFPKVQNCYRQKRATLHITMDKQYEINHVAYSSFDLGHSYTQLQDANDCFLSNITNTNEIDRAGSSIYGHACMCLQETREIAQFNSIQRLKGEKNVFSSARRLVPWRDRHYCKW